MSSFGQEQFAEEDVTKAETPQLRNEEIEEQEPDHYQHMFHIKNLRKISGLKDQPSYQIEAEDKDMINAQMMPHVCNGVLFTILFNYERADPSINCYHKDYVEDNTKRADDEEKPKRDFEGRTYLRILKHEENASPAVAFERYLQNHNCGEKDVKNAFPGILNIHKLYFSVVTNNNEDKTAKYEI